MNKIKQALTHKGKKAFVPYIMAGDGGLDILNDRLRFLQECGADAIEIGIPFSDPVADGPTIQRAGLRALKEGVTLKEVLKAIAPFNEEESIPLILMTYLNPVVAYGIKRFVEDAKKAGVSGCIIPDLPLEEEKIIVSELEEANITLIRLVTLTTPPDRIKKIADISTGFIYAVTVTGITGTRTGFNRELTSFLKTVKQLSSIPVLAGFGLSTSEQIREVCVQCDGVIVGSKIIDLFEDGDLDGIKKLIRNL